MNRPVNLNQSFAPHGSQSAADIAIVGLGCRYPGAKNTKELWRNIIARRQQFRRMPDVRLPLADYQQDDKTVADKTYGTQAAVIDGYQFDWAGHRIPKKTAQTTDIAHWLTIDTVLQMLEDAEYTPASLPKRRTQVIIGNTLTGEFTRSNMLRLRWPFIEKILLRNGKKLGVDNVRLILLAQIMEEQFKSISPTTNEDSLAGGLANTIAGRVCNYLDLHGGGYTVDGACSSSLIAVHTAATHLANGTIDFAIAGGIDISLDPFELIGFAKTGALTPTAMRVYDKRGNGFVPGEGCGIVGLKRLEDAERDGNKIYAVLDGWGISSDGKGGITAPSVDGQCLALTRAYQQAGIDISTLDFIEGHGTGTKRGDKTELLGIAKMLSDLGNNKARTCGVTSFKSIVGHTKAAAGVGAFIKTVISVNQRVIPPTAGCKDVHEVFSEEAKAIYPILRGQVMPPQKIMRAGVSAMGFGGINVHVTLKSANNKMPDFCPAVGERAALVSYQNTEIFCFSAENAHEMSKKLGGLAQETNNISLAEMVDLAALINPQSQAFSSFKVAIIASDPKELTQRLLVAVNLLSAHQDTPSAAIEGDWQQGVLIKKGEGSLQLGWLFPGQGSQRLNMARGLIERFEWAQQLVQQADIWAADVGTHGVTNAIYSLSDKMIDADEKSAANNALLDTRIAQPAIVLASLIWLTYFKKLGINAEHFLGHSLGELTAFYAAGAFDEKGLIQLACIRGQLMAPANAQSAGAMAYLACDAALAESLIALTQQQLSQGNVLVVANKNSPTETIASGTVAAIEALLVLAESQSIRAKRLNVSNAFHSPLVAQAAQQLKEQWPVASFNTQGVDRVISSCDGCRVSSNINVVEHFSAQITRQVDFVQACNAMAGLCDIVIEVGPAGVLAQLAHKNNPTVKTQAVEAEAESFDDFNKVLGLCFLAGRAIQWGDVYGARVTCDFVMPSAREFIMNPCENPISQIISSGLQAKIDALPVNSSPIMLLGAAPNDALIQVTSSNINTAVNHSNDISQPIFEIVANFTGFDVKTLLPEINVLDDLNLDSIKSAELVGNIAQHYKVQHKIDPADYATATLGEIVTAIKLAQGGAEPLELITPDVATHIGEPVFDVRAAGNSVKKLVADFTGFEVSSLALGMNILDDLNLDSIKSAELVAAIANHFNVHDKIDPAAYAIANLDVLVNDIAKLNERANVAQAYTAAVAAVPQGSELKNIVPTSENKIAAIIINAAAEFTGFDVQSITLQANILDDLNMDSIKSAELVAHIAMRLDVSAHLDPSAYATATLGQLMDDIQIKINSTGATVTQVLMPAPAAVFASNDVPSLNNVPAPNNVSEPKNVGPLNNESAELGGSDAQNNTEELLGRLNNWVRAYYQTPMLAADLPEIGDGMAGKVFLLQCDNQNLHAAITRYLMAYGISVIEAQPNADAPIGCDAMVFVLPNGATPLMDASDALQAQIKYFYTHALGVVKNKPKLGAIFIQLLPGQVSADVNKPYLTFGASAFAATLHLENPQINMHIVELPELLDSDVAARLALAELNAEGGYSASRIDMQGRRTLFKPTLCDPFNEPRNIQWFENDIVVVTGGAKGITAECALAFAQKNRTHMILLGSSSAEDNTAVTSILQRYYAEGLKVNYFACDIANKHAVIDLVATLQREYGPVAGVIHGAGLNRARRLEQTDADSAFKEATPKLLGAMNLLEALGSQSLKLLVGFTSIIGVTGMPGNAWYAFANETLNLTFNNYQINHPQTQVVCLAFSVWSDIGMGERTGSAKRLARVGISPIPPAAGIEQFMAAAHYHTPASQIIISSRLGALASWLPGAVKRPSANRFLQKIMVYQAGVEVIARCTLSTQSDKYLLDHNYRGTYLFPTVFGLEAMAQAVACALGVNELPPLIIKDVDLSRPIAVGGERQPSASTQIQIHAYVHPLATVDDVTRVSVGISTQQTGFKRNHFSAVFELSQPSLSVAIDTPQKPPKALAIDPQKELYGGILFQGQLFQRLKKVWRMSLQESLSSIVRDESAQYFADDLSQTLMLGDPSYRDVLLQSAQLSVKGILLPIHIDAIEIFLPNTGYVAPSLNNAYVVQAHTQVINRTPDDMHCNVTVTDERYGNVIECLRGYSLKQMERDDNGPAPEDFAHPEDRDSQIMHNTLVQCASDFNLTLPEYRLTFAPQLRSLSRPDRHAIEAPHLQYLAMQTYGKLAPMAAAEGLLEPVNVSWQENGKPVANIEGIHLSLSHDDRHCFYVAGQGAQGCDIEPIVAREKNAWLSLFAHKYHEAFSQLLRLDITQDVAGTALWCAIECLKKAGIEHFEFISGVNKPVGLLLSFAASTQIVQVLAAPLTLTRRPQKMLCLLVAEGEPKFVGSSLPLSSTIKLLASDSLLNTPLLNATLNNISQLERQITSRIEAGSNNSPVLCYRFPVTFKDTTTATGHVNFHTFTDWMGQIRERAITPVAEAMVADFVSGRWGMVTNNSQVTIFSPIKCMDLVEARLSIKRAYGKFNSSVDMEFDWLKILPNGSAELCARSIMATTWVEIVGHGQVKVQPFPAYMQKLIDDFLPMVNSNVEVMANHSSDSLLIYPDPLQGLLGDCLYHCPNTPQPLKVITSQRFDTTRAESNLVGNVYYSNYYHWQNKLIDRYIYALLKSNNVKNTVAQGLESVRSQVVHLREAMPYDTVEARLSIIAIYRQCVKFAIEFYSVDDQGNTLKLSKAENSMVWRLHGVAEAEDIPNYVIDNLLQLARTHSSEVFQQYHAY